MHRGWPEKGYERKKLQGKGASLTESEANRKEEFPAVSLCEPILHFGESP